jgi:hypothetical protein
VTPIYTGSCYCRGVPHPVVGICLVHTTELCGQDASAPHEVRSCLHLRMQRGPLAPQRLAGPAISDPSLFGDSNGRECIHAVQVQSIITFLYTNKQHGVQPYGRSSHSASELYNASPPFSHRRGVYRQPTHTTTFRNYYTYVLVRTTRSCWLNLSNATPSRCGCSQPHMQLSFMQCKMQGKTRVLA